MLKFGAQIGKDIVATTCHVAVVDISRNAYKKTKDGVLHQFDRLKEECNDSTKKSKKNCHSCCIM
jgi:hypothetical protein